MTSRSVRRSTRERRGNRRYVGADWDKETLRQLRNASTSSRSSPSIDDINIEAEEDDDFNEQATAAVDTVSSEDDLSYASEASSSVDDEEDDDELHRGGPFGGSRPARTLQRIPATTSAGVSRGLADAPRAGPIDVMYPLIFGPTDQDLDPVIHARSVWLKGNDATLPTRTTLSDPKSSSDYLRREDDRRGEVYVRDHIGLDNVGKGRVKPEDRSRGASYINRLLEVNAEQLKALLARQKTTAIDEALARSEGFLPYTNVCAVVTGWNGFQRSMEIQSAQSVPLSTSSDPNEHEGWLLNVGEKIQQLSWAPHAGTTRYLATVTRCTPDQRERLSPSIPHTFGPAFSATSSYPSAVHIWSFDSIPSKHTGLLDLDLRNAPRPSQVLGLHGGDIRLISWAPRSSFNNDDLLPHLLAVLSTDSHVRILCIDLSAASKNTQYLQIDNAAITIPPPTNTATVDITITSPDTPVFTSLNWLSTHSLALGTSNGHVQFFNILEDLDNSSQTHMTPCLSHPIHTSYITTITPALPSPYPILTTCTTSGHLSLTTLHTHPQTLHTHRARLPPHPQSLIYAPYTRSFLALYPPSSRTAAEFSSASTLVCHHLRRFYAQVQVARFPAAAILAGSHHHPCVLVGGRGGEVWATNYLRRATNWRVRGKGKGGFALTVVSHDWRAEVSDSSNGAAKEDEEKKHDLFHGPPLRQGVSRLMTGYKAQAVELGLGSRAADGGPGVKGGKRAALRKERLAAAEVHVERLDADAMDVDGVSEDADAEGELDEDLVDVSRGEVQDVQNGKTKKKRKSRAKPKDEPEEVDVSTAEIVYEEEQAVTAMDWCKDRQAAGWAAIGWGSGLVMVRDLSIDI